MEALDCLVVGGGVVGLAVARALALRGREVVVLERHDRIGSETSSRNSEVIHAGIYYPQGSLKARLCVEGRARLYQYCEARDIAHRRCGKLIIATSVDEEPQLEALRQKARANGVSDLIPLSPSEVREREPAVECVAALWSPSTGILDSHAFMLSLQADLESAGGMVVLKSPVLGGEVKAGRLIWDVRDASGTFLVSAKTTVNCAGLGGDRLARAVRGIDRDTVPTYRYAKGNYFALQGHPPFRSLVYPLPGQHGLGIHATIDMGGAVRFGPDVEWVEDIVYDVDPRRGAQFCEAIRAYWPGIAEHLLTPAYAGIRPKINGPSLPAADFVVLDEHQHKIPGLINLFGIESPGLTASLALAEYVAKRVDELQVNAA